MQSRNNAILLPCRSRSERHQFERCPEILHGHEKCFVPPVPGSVAALLHPGSPFQRKHGKILPFIARRDGRPVGCIAAIVNHSHNKHHGDRAGFFGFFACEDNAETAKSLFDAAADALRQHGCDSMRGPYSPSINDECGLLVEGFGNMPLVGSTWNPPYYERLVAACGFDVLTRLLSVNLPLAELPDPPRLAPIAARCRRQSKARLRMIDIAHLPEELAVIGEVYNSTLVRNTGFYPVTKDDLATAAKDLAPIARRETMLIAECDGERAGVALVVPNINEHLVRLKKTPRCLRLLHLLWLVKTRPIRTGRQIVYGVAPKFRDARGLHGWLVYEHFVEVKKVMDYVEMGWIEENNAEILAICDVVGATPRNRWKIFTKELGV